MSLYEFSVGEAVGTYEPKQRIPEQVRVIAVVVPEGHLIQIGRMMLGVAYRQDAASFGSRAPTFPAAERCQGLRRSFRESLTP